MQTDPSLKNIHSLGLPELPGKIPTYYAAGAGKRAAIIQNMLEDAIGFFEQQFQIDLEVSFAFLGLKEWQAATQIPYGLPWVSEFPYVIVLPTTVDHTLGQLFIQLAAQYDLLFAPYSSFDQYASDHLALIGFHELGHVVVRKYWINPPTLWLDEFFASYVAYAYMKEKYPLWAKLWSAFSETFVNNYTPQYHTLADFENYYAGVGIENYVWYEEIFLIRVEEVLGTNGLDFLRSVKQHLMPHQTRATDPFSLNALEQIAAGFEAWAQRFHLV